jgi:hypothetical protein
MSDGHKKGSVHFWRRLALEVRPYWSWIGLSFLTSILAAPFSLLLPFTAEDCCGQCHWGASASGVSSSRTARQVGHFQ